MRSTISLDEHKASVGGEARISDWFFVDQDRINAFADVTEDPQFIHIDVERAKAETPFGGTIAHGFLTLSMLSKFAIEVLPTIEGTAMGINYGFEKVRFLNPVPAGGRIRAHFQTKNVAEKGPGRVLTTTEVIVEIEGHDKPALVAEWLGMTVLAES
ncbi:MAG: MaoC family dehydratase [Pseudomonadota bacterium]